jgi:hypothetical protein
MSVVTRKTDFDSKLVCRDKPMGLPSNARLRGTVFWDEKESPEAERQSWLAASQACWAGVYGEAEPDYSHARLRKTPPCA